MESPNNDARAVKSEAGTENGNLQEGEHHDGVGGGNQQRQQVGWRGRGGGRGGFSRFDRRPPRDDNRNENEFVGAGGGGRDGDREGGPPRGGFRGRGGRGGQRFDRGDGMGGRTPDDRLMERVAQLRGPTYELNPLDTSEKKFSGRGRLYVGNISPEVVEEDIAELFKPYGETNELFYNKEKNFGFIRLDFHASAEKAKRELDGTNFKGRTLKIRFAPNGSTVKVKNLTPFVSNELLHYAFSVFGEIERSIVIVDDRGKSTGEGIVEYSRKGSATLAIRKCDEMCYFLTSSLRPVIVEQYDIVDDSDGFSEKSIMKKNLEFQLAREAGPRFANASSFEHEYGMRWKQLHELYAQKEKALKQEHEMEKEKLEAQMEYARYEHETDMLREQLRMREMDRERQKRDWEMKEQRVEDIRQRNQEQMRRRPDDMQTRMGHPEEDGRRRQETSLFMQAHKLDSLLDQEEQTFEKPPPVFESNAATEDPTSQDGKSSMLMDPKAFMNQFDRNHRFEGPRGGHWVNESRVGNRDDFPNKRRRF